ncbi:hypothetical protein [Pedobacter mendelii]|uniref:Uncharacterized protein n=1 Tax=Pedobacter mendelii TaxID=1908240 RepID=A0ABQ2BKN6_9SPHI|nr:hypothetical protein [Pedobacter mendelii]GGI28439.1 hypothetical protein GCM10008119_32650 [Pedobacter mendelii]
MNFKITSFLALAIFFANLSLKAQDVEENIRMVKPFKADGISNEWDEPLNQYNDATKLAFALANDDKNLYIIIESLDPQTTFNILRGGITLNINTQGKKRDGIKLTFPLMDRPQISKDGTLSEGKDELIPPRENDERGHDQATINKRIKVSGFKNIKDGNLPVVNEHGIETGMSIHPNRDLIYELIIPLAQLDVSLNLNKPLIYNIKLNQPGKQEFKKQGMPEGAGGRKGGMGGGGMGGGGGRGGMNGGKMGGGGQRPTGQGLEGSDSKKSDFWIKYKLVRA